MEERDAPKRSCDSIKGVHLKTLTWVAIEALVDKTLTPEFKGLVFWIKECGAHKVILEMI